MPSVRASLFAPLTALLLALCVGAVWPVVALVLRSDAAWMALFAALVAVFAVGLLALRTRWARAAIALLLTLVSVTYAQYLSAAAVVTSMLGIPFRTVLGSMGPEMAFALARARLSAVDAALIGVALALAAALAVLRTPPALTDQSS
jgi:hypothetical protein